MYFVTSNSLIVDLRESYSFTKFTFYSFIPSLWKTFELFFILIFEISLGKVEKSTEPFCHL